MIWGVQKINVRFEKDFNFSGLVCQSLLSRKTEKEQIDEKKSKLSSRQCYGSFQMFSFFSENQ